MEDKIYSQPLLSIIIATRNRFPYAISAVESILNIVDKRFELIVQDNSDTAELKEYIEKNIWDVRLRYQYIPPPLSMIDNFNAALDLAEGEYLCLIGDDDGINPEIIEAAKWAKQNSIDNIAVKLTANYLWKNSGIASSLFTKISGGDLTINSFRGGVIKCDLEQELKKLFHSGGDYYLNYKLPKLYHGLVNRKCMEIIRNRIGCYLWGLTPDIFASLSIACVAKTVMVTDYPLTISGVCSGSGVTLRATKKKRNNHEFLLRDRGEYRWCEYVPKVYTAETVWAESGIAAVRAMGRDDLAREINLPKLAAHCIIENRGIAKIVVRDLFRGTRSLHKNTYISGIQFGLAVVSSYTNTLVKRIWNRMMMIIGKKAIYRIRGLENMVDTSRALTRFLTENNCHFMDSVRNINRK